MFFREKLPTSLPSMPMLRGNKTKSKQKKVTAHKLPTGRRVRSVRAVSTELNNLRDFSE